MASVGPSRILVVDDDHQLRSAICRILERRGYGVIAVGTGLEALSLIAGSEPFDLVLSDVDMPGMSGFELVASLRRTYGAVRVLFMSGSVAETPDGHAILSKPFTDHELDVAVRAALHG